MVFVGMVQPAQANAWIAEVEALGLPGTDFLTEFQSLLATYEPLSTYETGFETWEAAYGP